MIAAGRLLLIFLALVFSAPKGSVGGLADSEVGRGGKPHLPLAVDVEWHDRNDVFLALSNRGQIGLDLFYGQGGGFYPIGTSNNYVFGTGLWIGGIADIDGDGDADTVFTQGYNPLAGDSEYQEGRIGQSPSDPLARLFDSTDLQDYLDWPPEFQHYDPEVEDTVPLIYSTQDIVTIYNAVDRGPVFGLGNLPLEVHQRTMAFRGPDIGQVIYLVFDITNRSADTPEGPYTIEDAWFGYTSDMDVGAAFSDDLASVLFEQIDGPDTLILDMGIAWDSDFTESNFTGIPGFVGVAMVQSPGNPYDGIDNDGDGTIDESPWNGLDDDNDGVTDEPDEVDEIGLVNFSKHCSPSVPCEVLDPQRDTEGYHLLSCDTPGSNTNCLESTSPADIRYMVSSGPFDWLPGETVRFVLAFIFSEPVGEPNELPFVGDPPRPDPNDPILGRLIEVTRATREFWLNGFQGYGAGLDILGTTVLEDTNDPFGPYEVNASVVDSAGLRGVSLFYRVDGAPFVEVPMGFVSGTFFSAEIPGAPFGSRLDYYVEAEDSLFDIARDPQGAPDSTYGFEIVDVPTFSDITEQSGLLPLDYSTDRVAWFDYDLDGDEDLYVASFEDILYRNDGDTLFVNVTAEAGITDVEISRGAQAADYDNDGDLDLYVANMIEASRLFRNNGDGTFTDVAEAAGVIVGFIKEGAVWGDYDRDGYNDLLVIRSPLNPTVLFRNMGDGTFEDRTEEANIGGVMANAARFFDRDGDGDLDLYIVGDGTNYLFHNNGNGTFSDRTEDAGLVDNSESFDLAPGDYDNDGDIDIFLLNRGPNRLFSNNGDGTFKDVAGEAGVSNFGGNHCTFADVNMDGYADLLLDRPYLLMNNGDGTFTDRSSLAGIQTGRNGMTSVDLGSDGFVDVYNGNLYENDGYPFDIGRNWLRVELEGTRSPRDGNGSLVVIKTSGLRQAKMHGDGTGQSMGSLPVEFGVDSAMVVDRVVVHWTSGIVQSIADVPVNRVITIVEDSTLTGIGGDDGITSASLPKVFALSQNYPNPFNPSTTIRYDIPVGRVKVPVKLRIYDVRGRLVRTLVDREREPGRYRVHWDGRDDRGAEVSSGVYLYRIKAGDYTSTRKMVLVQ